jgi:hypothetical protein
VQAANEKRYIARDNGYYTAEPVFAGFVNAALADGWKLVACEFEGMLSREKYRSTDEE